MDRQVSQGEDPRFLLKLTQRSNQRRSGTEVHGKGIHEGLCAERGMEGMAGGRVPYGAEGKGNGAVRDI